MYRSFSIKNFRCFRDLALEPLERVNLITGKNNTGKTALLEALWLHVGVNTPDLPLRLNLIRSGQTLADVVEVWGWMFFDKQVQNVIQLVSQSEDRVQRSMQVSLVQPKEFHQPPGNGGAESASPVGSLTTATGPGELLLDYQDTTSQHGTSRAFLTSEGIKFERMRLSQAPLSVFLSPHVRALTDDVARFSQLEAVGRQGEVLGALQRLEPRLRRLAILIKGATPQIYGDIGLSELTPLLLMGEGMGRLLSILLTIANTPGGVILVDEIENGLHHSTLTDLWAAVADAARRAGAQVFATTHSWECIRAAHEVFEASGTYDFRLHRLDRINDEVRVVSYDQKRLTAVVATDLEVR